VDERKSWNRLILAYSGVGLVVLTIAFFIARGAAHSGFIIAKPGSTAASSVVGVYNGIQPDATPVPTQSPSPAPSPSPSASASESPSPRPTAKASAEAKDARVAAAAAVHAKHSGKAHGSKLVADLGTNSDAAADTSSHIVPIAHADARPVEAPPVLEATTAPAPAPTEAPTSTPAPAAPAQPAANEPIFAPQRIVDAQVRVAVQPDESEADRERGAHGTSVVLVTIDPKGNVVSAVVGSSSGYSTLDRAAIAAARSSQFVAPKINGRPATETYRVVYDFGS
jgi:TonB family protein